MHFGMESGSSNKNQNSFNLLDPGIFNGEVFVNVRTLEFLTEEIQSSRSPDYVIKFTNELLMSKATMLKSLKGSLNSQLFGVRRAVTNFSSNYLELSEWNRSLLKFTKGKNKSE